MGKRQIVIEVDELKKGIAEHFKVDVDTLHALSPFGKEIKSDWVDVDSILTVEDDEKKFKAFITSYPMSQSKTTETIKISSAYVTVSK